MGINNRALINEIMANPYVLERQGYRYFFFRLAKDEYENMDYLEMKVEVTNGQAKLVLNGYLDETLKTIVDSGTHQIRIPVSRLEKGENILAYKGTVTVDSIEVHPTEVYPTSDNSVPPERVQTPEQKRSTDSYGQALEFLLDSCITAPASSPFSGSAYCLYDYTNSCYRMPCWLWSDAPVVSVLLDTIASGRYPQHHKRMAQLAAGICDVFLNTQILDEQEEAYGAYLSRYRYYAHHDVSFNRLLGPNDTSFSIKWAMLPMYEYTGDERYLKSAILGLEWVEKVIRSKDFVPSHYYFENKRWEDRAFVDTGFCVEGFQKYDEITNSGKYTELIDFTMKRYIRQFKLDNGFYGQNYLPGRGVDSNLFSRGQAWALEGLLACIREGVNQADYLAEAVALADLLAANQNSSGAFSWSMGNYEPDEAVKEGSGECEKGTAVLAWLMLELYQLTEKEAYLTCAVKSVEWCGRHIKADVREGFGGIASASICSGITGLPFLEVATGYANAFYLMARNKMPADWL